MSEVITTRREGGILEVTLDRPKANAIDLKTSRLMGETFRPSATIPSCAWRSSGPPATSSSAPAGTSRRRPAAMRSMATTASAALPACRNCATSTSRSSPAVNGMAVGGGFELALSCDLIYAADHSSFALPEIRAGTLADAATVKLPKRIPYHVAMDLLLTGRWMDVAEAHRWGLVNEVLPKEKLEDRVWEIARLLASGPPLVFAAIKEVAREAEAMAFQEAMNWITKRKFRTVDELYASEDGQEGFRAFAEKRDPVWKGR